MHAAIREARQRSKAAHPTSAPGYCLREVRECFGVRAFHPDAATAWREADHQHLETRPSRIPRGVPVFWIGGSEGHGHVAISTGDGKCWSTDILRPGYFDKVPISLVAEKWGMTLVGWTEDLNGVTVYDEGRGGPECPGPAPVDRTLVIAALVAFLGVLGAYVFLSRDNPDPEGIVRMIVTLAGLFGLGAVQRVQHKATARKLDKVEQKVEQTADDTARVVEQTNGSLDRRIRKLSYDSVRQALTDHLDDGEKPVPDPGDKPDLG